MFSRPIAGHQQRAILQIMTALSDNDLRWFAARLSIAVEDTRRETREMQLHDMRELLKDEPGYENLTIEYEPNGHQLLRLDGKILEVGPAASNAEIVQALKNTLVRTENTKLTITGSPKMVSKLQSVASRLGQLKHDVEFDADKLLTRVDGVFARKDAAFAKSHQHLDVQEKDLADVEGFITQIEQATNGAPS